MESRTKYLERKSKRYLEKYSRKIASYCYATAVLNSESGSYCMYFDEIEDYFNLDKQTIKNDIELQNEIINELTDFGGIAEVESEYNEYFYINLYTDYMALDDSEDDDEEEKIDYEHACFPAEAKKEEE